MSQKSEDDRAWMLEALNEEERVEHGLPEHEPGAKPPPQAPGAAKDEQD